MMPSIDEWMQCDISSSFTSFPWRKHRHTHTHTHRNFNQKSMSNEKKLLNFFLLLVIDDDDLWSINKNTARITKIRSQQHKHRMNVCIRNSMCVCVCIFWENSYVVVIENSHIVYISYSKEKKVKQVINIVGLKDKKENFSNILQWAPL